MTIRSHDQYNTTIYGLDDRYRGIRGERRVVFLNADDIARAGARRRARSSTSTSHFRGETRIAPRFIVVAYADPARLRRGLLPRGQRAGAAGALRRGSRTPTSKSIVIEVTPAASRE